MRVLSELLAGHEGYAAIQQLPGKDPEPVPVDGLGGIRRIRKLGQSGCWAGLTPRHRESDAKVARWHISKQGPRLLRWASCEAIRTSPPAPSRSR